MHGAALRLLPSIALSSARELSLQEIKNLCKIDLKPLDKQLLIEGLGMRVGDALRLGSHDRRQQQNNRARTGHPAC